MHPQNNKKKINKKIRWTSGGHAPVHPWLNCCEGLQTANCCETTYIQWCVNFGHKQTISSDPGGRDYDVIKQTCNQMGLERGYIPDTSPFQGGGLVSTANPGPPYIEQTFTEIHIQNVDTQSALLFDPSERLLCDDRSCKIDRSFQVAIYLAENVSGLLIKGQPMSFREFCSDCR